MFESFKYMEQLIVSERFNPITHNEMYFFYAYVDKRDLLNLTEVIILDLRLNFIDPAVVFIHYLLNLIYKNHNDHYVYLVDNNEQKWNWKWFKKPTQYKELLNDYEQNNTENDENPT